MDVQLNTGNTNMNIICAYIPQVECEEQENENFWGALDCDMPEIFVDEMYFIGGDLNGHISREQDEIVRVHKGLGMGIRSDEENSVIDFAVAWNLVVINSFFMKTLCYI
ncbi:uncharacterized protein [Diabrotica undecimpunctata]|uniref:uncharacterized protein n=1 Tax=Diabrotica undecimpunctata TaxID=50387 RepID=UPI003B63FA48